MINHTSILNFSERECIKHKLRVNKLWEIYVITRFKQKSSTIPNQGHPLALGGLATHNGKEKKNIHCRHYKLMMENKSSIAKAHENLDSKH